MLSKRIIAVLFCLASCLTLYSQVKIPVNQITAATTMSTSDIFLIVTNPAVGNGSTRVITLQNLLNSSAFTNSINSIALYNYNNNISDVQSLTNTVLQANIDTNAANLILTNNILQANIDTNAANLILTNNILQANIDTNAANLILTNNILQANIDTNAANLILTNNILQASIATNAANLILTNNILNAAITNKIDKVVQGTNVNGSITLNLLHTELIITNNTTFTGFINAPASGYVTYVGATVIGTNITVTWPAEWYSTTNTYSCTNALIGFKYAGTNITVGVYQP